MLFILSGEVQIGKTRWLQGVIEDLKDAGVISYGVISPGVWVESGKQTANSLGFEKLGIDSILLPQEERISFAQRTDLAKKSNTYDEESQSGRVRLGWHISDYTIDQVNKHFAALSLQLVEPTSPGMLVIDELGRLELMHGKGFVEAMRLLESGSSDAFRHAVVVARSTLSEEVKARFSDAWGGSIDIAPDAASRTLLIQQFIS